MKKYPRITVNPQKMGGEPCVRELRMPVATILAMMAEGRNADDILKEHPELEREDINEVLSFASELITDVTQKSN
ncbi:MAG: DUF433 domain-containing protein [Ignavibacteriota bacterium]|jgi:uncharacterized protein (DUF433 family)|nr:MAG: DUF433 domain-containing protein [Chlorobiota bacterium]MBE7475548.1 DUF433 domain-containing protein [Ignavibacteriales bacterium]MBL1122508.1 DUF433 domain-containing protein [Ignavibacteriota bacterium]MCZ7615557.1 DUF433 domain-containing protein [Ignavibacteriaceae bacterium]MEB2296209.1 DUF433 domain-containing protein [Ignavibacteria bacterium]